MPELSTSAEGNLFRVFVSDLQLSLDTFEGKVRNYVQSQLAIGRSRADIAAQLDADLAAETGIFRDLTREIERVIDYNLNTSFQISSNEPVRQTSELVKWTLDPAAEHCDSCLYQASLPPQSIATIPLPGSQPTHGETNCTSYCKCTLEPIEQSITEG